MGLEKIKGKLNNFQKNLDQLMDRLNFMIYWGYEKPFKWLDKKPHPFIYHNKDYYQKRFGKIENYNINDGYNDRFEENEYITIPF